MRKEEVFALDIGTRTIAGLILLSTEEGFEIREASVLQQVPGAMADGQIHQIEAVAGTIAKIKSELEAACEVSLKKAAVAAAGRSLLTETGSSSFDLSPSQRLSSDEVRAIELDAVRDAVKKLSSDKTGGVMHSYLCVGYSVTQYCLDGEPIGALQGHQGQRAQADVIATFLPRIVIDSLGTALHDAGLTMDTLTLEPIAAMHVVVPPTMRMLNIALVDVGAGTSDLAISAEGTVKGYGMVAYAGDAITKGIADHFLLDFKVAEQIKVELQPDQESECKDVFGNTLHVSYDDVLAVISPRVEILAEKIAQEIMNLNGSAPKGAILIGGGSRVPGFAGLLAKQLGLPENLVRIRDRSSLEIVHGLPHFSGPETITPIGIGCTHLDQRSMELIHVTVNDQHLQFLHMASSTIGEALLHAGLEPSELVGRPGAAFTVELNGRYIALPGTLGQSAVIQKNGEPSELGAPLADGDHLQVQPGKAGVEPHITLGEFIDEDAHSFSITFNGTPLKVSVTVLVNGKEQTCDYILQDRDQITLEPLTDIKDLFRHLGIPLEQEVPFYLNGESKLALESVDIFVGGAKGSPRTPLQSGLEIAYSRKPYTLRELLAAPTKEVPQITITVNGQKLKLTQKEPTPLANGHQVSFDYQIRPHDRIEYNPGSTGVLSAYIVTDIFRDYEPDEKFAKKGGSIAVNGKVAGFTTAIKHGDIVEFIPYGAGTANSEMP
jgi:cell division protein FtsA